MKLFAFCVIIRLEDNAGVIDTIERPDVRTALCARLCRPRLIHIRKSTAPSPELLSKVRENSDLEGNWSSLHPIRIQSC